MSSKLDALFAPPSTDDFGPTFADVLASPKPVRKMTETDRLELSAEGFPECAYVSGASVADRADKQAEISVMVHHDEAAYIETSARCVTCGHLDALHRPDHGVIVEKFRHCPICPAWCL